MGAQPIPAGVCTSGGPPLAPLAYNTRRIDSMMLIVVSAATWHPQLVRIASRTCHPIMSGNSELSNITAELDSAVSKAKQFGLPPLARWRLDEALDLLEIASLLP